MPQQDSKQDLAPLFFSTIFLWHDPKQYLSLSGVFIKAKRQLFFLNNTPIKSFKSDLTTYIMF